MISFELYHGSRIPPQLVKSVMRSQEEEVQIALLSNYATIPTRATPYSIGLDIYTTHEATIRPGLTETVRTDLQIKLPAGTYGRIAPCSGLSARRSLIVNGGVIDEDYRCNLVVILVNLGSENYRIKIGNRIAQLICQKAPRPFVVIRDQIALDTIRGATGFNSSGN